MNVKKKLMVEKIFKTDCEEGISISDGADIEAHGGFRSPSKFQVFHSEEGVSISDGGDIQAQGGFTSPSYSRFQVFMVKKV